MAESWEASSGRLHQRPRPVLAAIATAPCCMARPRAVTGWRAYPTSTCCSCSMTRSPAVAARPHRPFADWRGSGNAPPLVFEPRRSGPGRPTPFPSRSPTSSMRIPAARGRDPVAECGSSRPISGSMLEHEFLGKLLQLRRGYVALADERDGARATGHGERAHHPDPPQRALLSLVGRAVPREHRGAGPRGCRRSWAPMPTRSSSSCGTAPTRSGSRRGSSSKRTWRPSRPAARLCESTFSSEQGHDACACAGRRPAGRLCD